MCGPAALPVAAIVASVAATGYTAYSQKKGQKDAQKASDKAEQKAELELKSKTPELQTQDNSGQRIKAINAYRAGVLGNIKTSGIGVPGQANVVNQSAASGLKTKIGE
ncbi:hypothetical protein Dip510_000836 [Elusimicrobium posterum]|uniref:hypothetical protein n=1 Tax=Elusimicrobium posterum TaxID=3116653 RepID=UPI003C7629A8